MASAAQYSNIAASAAPKNGTGSHFIINRARNMRLIMRVAILRAYMAALSAPDRALVVTLSRCRQTGAVTTYQPLFREFLVKRFVALMCYVFFLAIHC